MTFLEGEVKCGCQRESISLIPTGRHLKSIMIRFRTAAAWQMIESSNGKNSRSLFVNSKSNNQPDFSMSVLTNALSLLKKFCGGFCFVVYFCCCSYLKLNCGD